MSPTPDAPPPALSDRTLARARRMMKGEILEGRPDPAGLQSLAEIVFPGEDLSDPRFLRWLYEENPVRPAYELMTRSGGTVSGHIAGVPIRYRLAGKDVLGGIAVNAITHPDHRGKGIFIVLHAELSRFTATKDMLFLFGFANPNSEKGCLRHLNYRDLGRFPLWILPLDLGKVMKAQEGIPGILRTVGAAAGAPLLGLWKAARRPRGIGGSRGRADRELRPRIRRVLGLDGEGLCEHRRPGREVPRLALRQAADAPVRHLRRPVRRPAGRISGRDDRPFQRPDLGDDRRPARARLARRPGRGVAADRRLYTATPALRAPTSPRHSCSAMRPAAPAFRKNGYLVAPRRLMPREFPILAPVERSSSASSGRFRREELVLDARRLRRRLRRGRPKFFLNFY